MKKILNILAIITLFIACQTFVSAQETDFPYEITDMYFTDLMLNPVENMSGGCFTNIKVKSNSENAQAGFITVAAYDSENRFLGSTFMRTDGFSANSERLFGTTISIPGGKTISKVKAFVVSNMKTLTPLSETTTMRSSGEKYTNIFTVNGYVSGDYRSNGISNFKNKLEINIEFIAFDYAEEEYGLKPGQYIRADCKLDDIPQIASYGSFTIFAENNNYTILSYSPLDDGRVILDSNLYDENTISWNGAQAGAGSLFFFNSKSYDNRTEYKLSGSSVDLYVNGVNIPYTLSNFSTYISNNTSGKVTLIDRDHDGKYDIISADYYATALIGQINLANSGKVTFDKVYGQNSSTYIYLDEADEDKIFKIYLNGEEIKPSDLKVYDVLSIKYNTNESSMNSSEFYTIYVSRDTAEGQYTETDTSSETFVVGGKSYEFTEGFEAGKRNMAVGFTYKLYLDAFGRIFDVDVSATNYNYAIIDRYFNRSSGDDYYSAILYTMDGTTKIGEVDLSAAAVREGVAAKAGTTYTSATTDAQVEADLMNLVYKDTNGTAGIQAYEQKNENKTPIEERVVSYKLSSSGKITSLEFMPAMYATSAATSTYNADKMAIGSIKMNSMTKIIDATDYDEGTRDATYSNLSITSPATLTDENGYDAFCFGAINKRDKSYPLVIITGAGGTYSSSSSFAVLTESPNDAITADGSLISKASALYNGQTVTLSFDDETRGYDATGAMFSYECLRKGDVIVFTKNNNDRIKCFDIIATANSLGINESSWSGMSNKAQSEAFMNTAFAQTTPYFAYKGSRSYEFNNWTGKWVNSGSGALSDAAGEILI